jgi:hypothetical protein
MPAPTLSYSFVLCATPFPLLLRESVLLLALSLFDGLATRCEEPWQVFAVAEFMRAIARDSALRFCELDRVEQTNTAASAPDPLHDM